jgi:hypothetical protein
MSNTDLIVSQINGEDRIDSRLVAQNLDIEHRAFIQTLRKYEDKLQELGILTFEMAKLSSVGHPETYVMLNENQAIFAMTLSRNTEQVVELKLKLTQAFAASRKAPIIQSDPLLGMNMRLDCRTPEDLDKAARIIAILRGKAPRSIPAQPRQLTAPDLDAKILEVVQKLGEPSARDIHDYIKWADRATIETHCEALARLGKLQTLTTSRTKKYHS